MLTPLVFQYEVVPGVGLLRSQGAPGPARHLEDAVLEEAEGALRETGEGTVRVELDEKGGEVSVLEEVDRFIQREGRDRRAQPTRAEWEQPGFHGWKHVGKKRCPCPRRSSHGYRRKEASRVNAAPERRKSGPGSRRSFPRKGGDRNRPCARGTNSGGGPLGSKGRKFASRRPHEAAAGLGLGLGQGQGKEPNRIQRRFTEAMPTLSDPAPRLVIPPPGGKATTPREHWR